MTFSLGIVGAGQFSGSFASLFKQHPGISSVVVTDQIPQRAQQLVDQFALDGAVGTFDELLASDVDAVGIFTQRWTHGPLVVRALRAGKHVYSAVPMAISHEEIAEIIRAVDETGLTYMMGETSYYSPATVYARGRVQQGDFGRLVYAEGDYMHDMDLGFYKAYQHSGGDNWQATASYPPMLYPTHAIGGVLGAWPTHAVSVSCTGVHDQENDGVFDTSVSMFDNDFSNMIGLFELADGGVMRTCEMRRVGYPSKIRESRFRFFGTDASFEQLAKASVWENKHHVEDISELLLTQRTLSTEDEALEHVDPDLRDAFVSGHAAVHDRSVLPAEYDGLPNGHEGSHHFLAHEFVSAVNENRLPSVNAWVAARFTLPGIVANESARRGGERLPIDDFGDPSRE